MNYRNETVGMLSVKQVYEIALVKSQDIIYDCVPLQKICREIIDEALFMGVKVVHRIDEKEYALFLEERKKIVAKQLADLDEIRQARMMRTT
jgi:large subunit ribosomal protein L11